MATSNNALAPDAVTDIDGPEVHRHSVPITNIEEPGEDFGEGVPVGEAEDDHGEPPLVPGEP